jgi:DNA-binding LacI/PurR family transcriptional regulator
MSSPTKPASIMDVAKLAGVSVPTVSRVLTGAARVAPDKVVRIEEAIEQLQYRPNAVARALVSGSSNMIVVLASNTTYYGYAATIQGVEEAARVAGMMVMITVIQSSDKAHVTSAVQSALRQPIAGIVVLKFDVAGVAALAQIPGGTPVAVASGLLEHEHPQAVMDEFAGGEAATRYLLSLGHKTVHHISIPQSGSGEDLRTLGWRKALGDSGITAPPVVASSWDPQTGARIGRELAARADVTAIFCGNDEIAMGVISGARAGGRRIPEDLSVVGFDDHPLSSLWSPALTTVRQDFVALGRNTFELLWNSIRTIAAPTHTSEATQLIIRESAARPATESP